MSDWVADDSPLGRAFERVVAAADGTDRPDWLATAAERPAVGDALAALAGVVTTGDEPPGTAYQHHLSAEQQATSGHFATDPALAEALCRWAVREDVERPRVLDFATGSGVFTVAAYERLATTAPGLSAAERLKRVVGVDTDPVALAVTAARLLAAADLETGPVALYETDFFDLVPGEDGPPSVTGDRVSLGPVDAVVGNPPYVRQETTDIDHARAHLSAFGPAGTAPYADGDRALSRRSDAYVYFLTHATQFLRAGGRLGVVVPDKWLTTQYGEQFRQFLFDHYRVAAVVGFGARAFEDALVDTVLLLAERCPDTATRRATPVRFCRLDEQVSIRGLLSAVEDGRPLGDESMVVDSDSPIRTVTVRQSRLAGSDADTLLPYLNAPAPFIRLLADPQLTPLGEFTTVRRGVMTGANDFFFLDADTDVADRFRRPAIKSIRDVSGRTVTTVEADRYLLDVHDYVREVRASHDGCRNLAGAVRDALARDGYDALAAHIEWGREQGYHERRSCASRPVWFDLGGPTAPTVFVPKFFDERVLVVANPDGLLASNAVDCLWVDDSSERVLLGVLNSTVVAALMECWGRAEGGGALQLLTYELGSLPVPDPRSFTAGTAENVAEATDDLLAGDESALRRLDSLVLDALDADLSVETCRRLRERMVQRRVQGGDTASRPLLDR